MEGDAFSSNVLSHVAAIQLCLSNHLRLPALVLIYCGIDFMANLSRPMDQPEQSRNDFIKWAEGYMTCESRLSVSGLDLYAARCGILHTYTMDSRLSAEGKAKRILYAWGDRSPEKPMELLKALGFRERVVRIEDLAAAFFDGIDAFSTTLGKDKNLASVVQRRSRKLFRDQQSFPGVD